MKTGFKKALRLFRYFAIVFTIAFWIYIIIDDWTFIDKYGSENLAEYIRGWCGWYIGYFIAFSFYYWILATIIILVYYRLQLKPRGAN